MSLQYPKLADLSSITTVVSVLPINRQVSMSSRAGSAIRRGLGFHAPPRCRSDWIGQVTGARMRPLSPTMSDRRLAAFRGGRRRVRGGRNGPIGGPYQPASRNRGGHGASAKGVPQRLTANPRGQPSRVRNSLYRGTLFLRFRCQWECRALFDIYSLNIDLLHRKCHGRPFLVEHRMRAARP